MIRITSIDKMKIEREGTTSYLYTDYNLFVEDTKGKVGNYFGGIYDEHARELREIEEEFESRGEKINGVDFLPTEEEETIYTYSANGKFYCDEDRMIASYGKYPV